MIHPNHETSTYRTVKIQREYRRCAAQTQTGSQCTASEGDTGRNVGGLRIYRDPEFGPTRIYLCARHLAAYDRETDPSVPRE